MIKRLPKDKVCIVLSGGIDEVKEDLAKEVIKSHRATFCLIPPSWERLTETFQSCQGRGHQRLVAFKRRTR